MFQRVRLYGEKRLSTCHVRLSSRIGAAPTGRISVIFFFFKYFFGAFMESCRETPNLVQQRPKISYSLYGDRRNVFVVAADRNSPFRTVLCNTQYFYIIVSDI